MDEEHKVIGRRKTLKLSAAMLAALAAAPLLVLSRQSLAGSAIKADFHYQDSPKDGKKCAECVAYIAEGSMCKVFGEPVSPSGWCMAFSKAS